MIMALKHCYCQMSHQQIRLHQSLHYWDHLWFHRILLRTIVRIGDLSCLPLELLHSVHQYRRSSERPSPSTVSWSSVGYSSFGSLASLRYSSISWQSCQSWIRHLQHPNHHPTSIPNRWAWKQEPDSLLDYYFCEICWIEERWTEN